MTMCVVGSLPRAAARAEPRGPVRRAQGVAGAPGPHVRHRPALSLALRALPEGPRVPHHRPLRALQPHREEPQGH